MSNKNDYHLFFVAVLYFPYVSQHLAMDLVRDMANLTVVEELDYALMSFSFPVYPIYGAAKNGKMRTWKTVGRRM